VFEKLSPTNRARLERMSVTSAAKVCWKLVK
jgi:hypothetical protein